IQSDFRSGDHGNFEVVVPLQGPNGRVELWHFWHDNSDVTLPWRPGQRITGDGDQVAGPGSITQSDFRSGSNGNFEVVVPLLRPSGAVELWHFWHDNSDVELPWRVGQRVTGEDEIAGPGTIIQSSFRAGSHGNFEVLAPRRLANGAV